MAYLNGQAMTLMVGGDERSLEAVDAIVKKRSEGKRKGKGKGRCG
jgi:6-phosphogluconate dehydrogenase (decarboxylating)